MCGASCRCTDSHGMYACVFMWAEREGPRLLDRDCVHADCCPLGEPLLFQSTFHKLFFFYVSSFFGSEGRTEAVWSETRAFKSVKDEYK